MVKSGAYVDVCAGVADGALDGLVDGATGECARGGSSLCGACSCGDGVGSSGSDYAEYGSSSALVLTLPIAEHMCKAGFTSVAVALSVFKT